jgi:hypothetical protein
VLLNERCSCGAERSQPSLVGVYHVHQAVAAPLSALDARLTGNTQRVPLDTERFGMRFVPEIRLDGGRKETRT